MNGIGALSCFKIWPKWRQNWVAILITRKDEIEQIIECFCDLNFFAPIRKWTEKVDFSVPGQAAIWLLSTVFSSEFVSKWFSKYFLFRSIQGLVFDFINKNSSYCFRTCPAMIFTIQRIWFVSESCLFKDMFPHFHDFWSQIEVMIWSRRNEKLSKNWVAVWRKAFYSFLKQSEKTVVSTKSCFLADGFLFTCGNLTLICPFLLDFLNGISIHSWFDLGLVFFV